MGSRRYRWLPTRHRVGSREPALLVPSAGQCPDRASRLVAMAKVTDGFQLAFAIITTRANSVMAPIHDRMPVVIETARLDTWMTSLRRSWPQLGLCSGPHRNVGWPRSLYLRL